MFPLFTNLQELHDPSRPVRSFLKRGVRIFFYRSAARHGVGVSSYPFAYVHTRISRAQSTKSLTAGVQGPLKGPRSSRIFDALSCDLSLILSILIQNGIQNNTVDQILGGGGWRAPPPPSKSATCSRGSNCSSNVADWQWLCSIVDSWHYIRSSAKRVLYLHIPKQILMSWYSVNVSYRNLEEIFK